MIRALFSAASGMVAQTIKQDITANNIANAQTPGFKRDRMVAASFSEALRQKLPTGSVQEQPPYPDSPVQATIVSAESQEDASQGPVRVTGNNLDFAIQGPGSFEVSLNGATRLTRAGDFHLNANRELCTSDGAVVNGNSGAIQLLQGEWTVGADGTVTAGGQTVDKIKIVGADPKETTLAQGSLEGANTNIVSEMVEMIGNMRSFEANQKVVIAIDHTLDKLINEAGKV